METSHALQADTPFDCPCAECREWWADVKAAYWHDINPKHVHAGGSLAVEGCAFCASLAVF